MATRLRSQSSTPKPPSPSPIDGLESIPPSAASLPLSPSAPSSSLSSPSAPSSGLPPIAFNTSIFARDSHNHLPRIHSRDVVQAHAHAQVQAQAQAQGYPQDRFADGSPIASASAPPLAPSGDSYPAYQPAISILSPSIHPTARSMSIQSLVSSTGGTSSFADDDSSSIVSHTTTRNTEDDDDDDRDRDLSSISVDIDDPDVRMAAEALGDLRADFVSSPKSVPNSPPPAHYLKEERKDEHRQQSMMEIIQGQNTFLGTAVRAGSSVYRGGKRYSPRFKYGAEMVERAAAPMTSVVSYAARTTGVESVLRRNLEARRLSSSTSSQSQSTSPSHSQPSSATSSHATKRRKTTFEDTAMDVDLRSPSSTDNEQPLTHKPARDVVSLNWQRRLMLSTAGVGVAMSEESLKSLKYCLAWLRWANDHLDKVIMALRGVIREYDADVPKGGRRGAGDTRADDDRGGGATADERSAELQHKIDSLRKDVIGTLKRVVDVVSTYAGGALPENARVVVKACITNLPRRWALAAKDDGQTGAGGNGGSNTAGGPNSTAMVVRREEAGKRVLVLAREGLEMLHQVSAIVQLTLERAEEWCDRLGKRRPDDPDYGKVGWDVDMELEMNGVGVEGRKDR